MVGRLLFIALFTFASDAFAAGELKISASSTVMNNIFDKIKAPFEKETGIKLVFFDAKGAENYWKLMAEDKVEAAVLPGSYEEWLKVVKSKNVPVPNDIKYRTLGGDLLTVIVNAETGIKSLDLAALSAIYSGKSKNWNEFGSKDIPIKVYGFLNSGSKNATFKRSVLPKEEFRADLVQLQAEDVDMRQTVGKTPGAIGFVSESTQTPGVTNVQTPDVGRPITLVHKGVPSENLRKLETFIRTQGPTYGVRRVK